jgi:hypothetical protein
VGDRSPSRKFRYFDNIKYHLGDQIEKCEMGGHVAGVVQRREVYRVLVGKPERKRPLGRPNLRCEDNIKMDLQEVGWGAWTGGIWLRIGKCGGLL